MPPTVSKGGASDPLALAEALLQQAETSADPAALIKAARTLVQEAQQDAKAERDTGS